MSQKIDMIDVYEFLLKHDVDEPVTIVKHGEPHAVILPYEIFEAMRKNTRRALHVSELTKEELDAILTAEIPEELKQFDHEVKK